MRIRSLCALAILLLLTGCSLQIQNGVPVLRPDSARSMPTLSPTAFEPSPTDNPVPSTSPEPSATPGLELTPSATPTVTPAPIDPGNAIRLRPVAIYPFFRRGLLHSVRWSPDSTSLIVETNLGLQVLSATDLQKRFSLPDTNALYFLENGDLLVMENNIPMRFSPSTGKTSPLPVELPSAEEEPIQFALSPNGKYWVTAQGAPLTITDLETNQQSTVKLVSKTLIAFSVEGLYFSPDSRRLYAHIRRVDNETELIAIDTGSWRQIYEAFNADSRPVFSPDSKYMVYDRGDRIWIDQVEDGKNWSNLARKSTKKLSEQEQNVLTAVSVSFLNRDSLIGVLYNDTLSNSRAQEERYLPASLMIYDTAAAKAARYINGLPPNVVAFGIAPDGNTFYTTSKDGVLRLWNVKDGSLLKESQPYEMDPDPDVQPDGKLAAYGLEDRISLVDPTTGQVKDSIGDYPGATRLQGKFVGSDRLAVFVQTEWRKFIDIYQLADKKFLFRYPDLGNCDFNAAGNLMICVDQVVKFFDLPTGNALLDLVPQGSGQEYTFSGDGNRVAACTRGAEFIYVWEIRLGAIPKYTLGGNAGSCGKLAFSSDGQKLASSSGYVWEVTSGKQLLTFSPSGDGLMVASPAGDLLLVYPNLIDLSTGEELGHLQAAPDIHRISFQPDGLSLVLETRRGIEFWSIGP